MNDKDPTANEIRDAAKKLYRTGMSVIKVRGDGTKRPYGRWEDAQHNRATGVQLSRSFPEGEHRAEYGVGVVCGAVSGGLLMIEFEGAAVREGWVERADLAMQAAGLGAAWEKVMGGWAEYSPSGGIHMHVLVTDGPCPGNLKLAQRQLLPEEFDARQKELYAADTGRTWPKTMIETRGEGGLRVAAPSGGPVHPSGRRYAQLLGGPEAVPEMTLETVEAVFAVLRSLNTYEVPQRARSGSGEVRKVERADGGLSPFEDFKERGDWAEILDGVLDYTETRSDGVQLWTRVGKDPRDGHSATIGHGGDILHVFSSSVAELPVGRSLNKAQAYCYLRFGSLDTAAYSDAARELAYAGYGSQPSKRGLSSIIGEMSDQQRFDPAIQARYDAEAAQLSAAAAEVLERGVKLIGSSPDGYALVAFRAACKGLAAVGTAKDAGPLVNAVTQAGALRSDAVREAKKIFGI